MNLTARAEALDKFAIPEKFYRQTPWAHQREAIERAKTLDEFALFMEAGTGKTLTAINILRLKFLAHNRVLRTLILCPLIVTENWVREWAANSNLKPGQVEVLKGTGKQRALQVQAALRSQEGKVFVTNYEALLMPELFRLLTTWRPEALLLDESHRCKDPSAKRTKLCFELAKETLYRYILSGTPVLNNLMDVFSQFKILDRGTTFGTNFFVFRAQYFWDKNVGMPATKHFPDWRTKQGAMEEIQKKIAAKGMAVKKEDCLDLPPLVRERVYVELSKPQRKLYDEMKRDFITFIGDQAVTASLAITKALRLMQIISGFAQAESDGGTTECVPIKDNPRAAALRELLQEIAPFHKVIVWAVFKRDYETISKVVEELSLDYVLVHGETSNKHETIERFQTDPKLRVLVGHPGAAGIGVNITAASYAIYYSRNFSLEQYLQSEARNYRGGSEIHEKITHIDIVAKDTLDEQVVEALGGKRTISVEVLKECLT